MALQNLALQNPTLQDRLDAFKADVESGRFPRKPTREALDAMHRAGAVDAPVPPNNRIPENGVTSADGFVRLQEPRKDCAMSKLNGKIAVITGGSSGIGLAAAKRFVEEGAHVFIMGRRQSELDKAKAEIGKNVTTVQGDVANLGDLDRLYRTVKDEKGAVDIVVASAGFVERVLTQDATPVHFDKTFGINARGVYFTVQKALPLMRKGGAVVLVSSGLHLKGLPEHGVYAATKAAVRSFARTFTMELKDRGIRVNTLSPGAIETPIIDGQFKTREEADGARAFFSQITPLGRIGRPEEMASAILFLASDDSSYSTGIDLAADGGITQV
jgi:NAD(P)-dependent dehydrogenase (short-subunit alcohol dehydrogenase family)